MEYESQNLNSKQRRMSPGKRGEDLDNRDMGYGRIGV